MREPNGWNPYLAGGLSAFVSIFSVWFTGNYLGASTTFVRVSGFAERVFDPQKIAKLEYFVKIAPKVDWQFMVVIGIALGAFIAAVTSGSFRLQAVPAMWEERFGASVGKRAIAAFVGGIIAMFGARLADGCPSGHGLSGSLQLAVSGYVALVAFFVGGMLVVRLLYGKENA